MAPTDQTLTPVSRIQGQTVRTNQPSPFRQRQARVGGVVTAYSQQRGGYFIQSRSFDRSSRTSEGLFLETGGRLEGVRPGDRLQARGTVTEFAGDLTGLDTRPGLVSPMPGKGTAQAMSRSVVGGLFRAQELGESSEGMKVSLSQPLTVAQVQEDGTVIATKGRLQGGTEEHRPGDEAMGQQARNRQRIVRIDPPSGRSFQVGQKLKQVVGVADRNRYSDFRILASQVKAGKQSRQSPPNAPKDDEVRAATYNLARATGEKKLGNIAEYLSKSKADVIGLQEIPSGQSRQVLKTLADKLGENWRYIQAPKEQKGQPIEVGILYNQVQVEAKGDPKQKTDGAFRRLNRAPLAQSFSTEEGTFTYVVNHFKSKSGTGYGKNREGRDGQGAFAYARTKAAYDLMQWLSTNPTGVKDPDYLVGGDLNAYAKSDAVQAFRDLGYLDTVGKKGSEQDYTFIFRGQFGRLDHLLASPALKGQVSGAGVLKGSAGYGSKLSDHNLAYADLNLATSSPGSPPAPKERPHQSAPEREVLYRNLSPLGKYQGISSSEPAKPTYLPSSFYNLYRDRMTLPTVNLYESDWLNRGLNRASLKERINRFARHRLGIRQLVGSEQTLLGGLIGQVGRAIDIASGAKSFQVQELARRGVSVGTPASADNYYKDQRQYDPGLFETAFEKAYGMGQAVTTALLSYGLFRGTSLFSSYMEDELSNFLYGGQRRGTGRAFQSFARLVIGGGPSDRKMFHPMTYLGTLGHIRRFQQGIFSTVTRGALETIAAADTAKTRKELKDSLDELERKVGEPPMRVKESSGRQVIANFGSERLRTIARAFDRVAGFIPANIGLWAPQVRRYFGVDHLDKQASLADVLGVGLEGILDYFESSARTLSRFVAKPVQSIRRVNRARQMSRELAGMERRLTRAGPQALQAVEDYSAKFRSLQTLVSQIQGSDPMTSQYSTFRPDPEGAYKTVGGVSARSFRRGVLGAGVVMTGDFLVDQMLLSDKGIGFTAQLYHELSGKEDIDRMTGATHWTTTLGAGVTAGGLLGRYLPAVSMTRGPNASPYRDFVSQALEQGQIRQGPSNYQDFVSQARRVPSLPGRSLRVGFNQRAGMFGFAAGVVGLKLATTAVAGVYNLIEGKDYQPKDIASLLAPKIQPFTGTSSGLSPQELGDAYAASIFKQSLHREQNVRAKTVFSTSLQYPNPIAQFTMISRTNVRTEQTSLSFGMQLFPLLGTGVTPTMPLALRWGKQRLSPTREAILSSKYNWAQRGYHWLTTAPARSFAYDEKSQLPGIASFLGTTALVGSGLQRVAPDSLKRSNLYRLGAGSVNLTQDIFSTIFATSAMMVDATKEGGKRVLSRGIDLGALGQHGGHTKPTVARFGRGARMATPFLLSWAMSSTLADPQGGYLSDPSYTRDPMVQATATLGLTAIGTGALSVPFNPFARSEDLAELHRRRVAQGKRVSRDLQRIAGNRRLIDADDPGIKAGKRYLARFAGRGGAVAKRLGALGAITQIALPTVLSGDMQQHLLRPAREDRGFFGEVASAMFAVLSPHTYRDDQLTVYDRELGRKRKVNLNAQLSDKDFLGRAKTATGRFLQRLNPARFFRESGAYVDDPNAFMNLYFAGVTFRGSDVGLYQKPYVQFQGSLVDISASVSEIVRRQLSQRDRGLYKSLLSYTQGDRKLTGSGLMAAVRMRSVREDPMSVSRVKDSELSEISSSHLALAVRARSHRAKTVSYKDPATLFLEYLSDEVAYGGIDLSGKNVPSPGWMPHRPYMGMRLSALERGGVLINAPSLGQMADRFLGNIPAKRQSSPLDYIWSTFRMPGIADSGETSFFNKALATAFGVGMAGSFLFSAGTIATQAVSGFMATYESLTNQDYYRRTVQAVSDIRSQAGGFLVRPYMGTNDAMLFAGGGREKGPLTQLWTSGIDPNQVSGYEVGQEMTRRFRGLHGDIANMGQLGLRLGLNHPSATAQTYLQSLTELAEGATGFDDIQPQVRGQLRQYASAVRDSIFQTLQQPVAPNQGVKQSLGELIAGDSLTAGQTEIDKILGTAADTNLSQETLVDKLEKAYRDYLEGRISYEQFQQRTQYEAASAMKQVSEQLFPNTPVAPEQVKDSLGKTAGDIEEAMLAEQQLVQQRLDPLRPGKVSPGTRQHRLTHVLQGSAGEALQVASVPILGRDIYQGVSALYSTGHRNFYVRESGHRLASQTGTMLATELAFVGLFSKRFGLIGSSLMAGASYVGYNRWAKPNSKRLQRFDEQAYQFYRNTIGKWVGRGMRQLHQLPMPDLGISEAIVSQRRQMQDQNPFVRTLKNLFIPRSAHQYAYRGLDRPQRAFGYSKHVYGAPYRIQKRISERELERASEVDSGIAQDVLHPNVLGYASGSRDRIRQEQYFAGNRILDPFSLGKAYEVSSLLRMAIERRQDLGDAYGHGLRYKMRNARDRDSGFSTVLTQAFNATAGNLERLSRRDGNVIPALFQGLSAGANLVDEQFRKFGRFTHNRIVSTLVGQMGLGALGGWSVGGVLGGIPGGAVGAGIGTASAPAVHGALSVLGRSPLGRAGRGTGNWIQGWLSRLRQGLGSRFLFPEANQYFHTEGLNREVTGLARLRKLTGWLSRALPVDDFLPADVLDASGNLTRVSQLSVRETFGQGLRGWVNLARSTGRLGLALPKMALQGLALDLPASILGRTAALGINLGGKLARSQPVRGTAGLVLEGGKRAGRGIERLTRRFRRGGTDVAEEAVQGVAETVPQQEEVSRLARVRQAISRRAGRAWRNAPSPGVSGRALAQGFKTVGKEALPEVAGFALDLALINRSRQRVEELNAMDDPHVRTWQKAYGDYYANIGGAIGGGIGAIGMGIAAVAGLSNPIGWTVLAGISIASAVGFSMRGRQKGRRRGRIAHRRGLSPERQRWRETDALIFSGGASLFAAGAGLMRRSADATPERMEARKEQYKAQFRREGRSVPDDLLQEATDDDWNQNQRMAWREHTFRLSFSNDRLAAERALWELGNETPPSDQGTSGSDSRGPSSPEPPRSPNNGPSPAQQTGQDPGVRKLGYDTFYSRMQLASRLRHFPEEVASISQPANLDPLVRAPGVSSVSSQRTSSLSPLSPGETAVKNPALDPRLELSQDPRKRGQFFARAEFQLTRGRSASSVPGSGQTRQPSPQPVGEATRADRMAINRMRQTSRRSRRTRRIPSSYPGGSKLYAGFNPFPDRWNYIGQEDPILNRLGRKIKQGARAIGPQGASRALGGLGLVGDIAEIGLAGYGSYEMMRGMKTRDRARTVRGGKITGGALGGLALGTAGAIAVGALGLPALATVGLGLAVAGGLGYLGSRVGSRLGGRAARRAYDRQNRNAVRAMGAGAMGVGATVAAMGAGLAFAPAIVAGAGVGLAGMAAIEAMQQGEPFRRLEAERQRHLQGLGVTASGLWQGIKQGVSGFLGDVAQAPGKVASFASKVPAKVQGAIEEKAEDASRTTMFDTPSAPVEGGRVEATGLHPNVKAFLDTIAKAEGTYGGPHRGYRTYFGGDTYQGDLSQGHPMKTVAGRSSAFGRYQFMDFKAEELGLDESITPREQDLAAVALLEQRGLLEDVRAGNFQKVLNDAQLSSEWAGFPGDPYGQPETYSKKELLQFTRRRQRVYQGKEKAVSMAKREMSDVPTEPRQRSAEQVSPGKGQAILVAGHSGKRGTGAVNPATGKPEERVTVGVARMAKRIAEAYGMGDVIRIATGNEMSAGESVRGETASGKVYTSAGYYERRGVEYYGLHFNATGGKPGIIYDAEKTEADRQLMETYGSFQKGFRNLYAPNRGGTVVEFGAADSPVVNDLAGANGPKARKKMQYAVALNLVRRIGKGLGYDVDHLPKAPDLKQGYMYSPDDPRYNVAPKPEPEAEQGRMEEDRARKFEVEAKQAQVSFVPPDETYNDIAFSVAKLGAEFSLYKELELTQPQETTEVKPDYSSRGEADIDEQMSYSNQDTTKPRKPKQQASRSQVKKTERGKEVDIEMEESPEDLWAIENLVFDESPEKQISLAD